MDNILLFAGHNTSKRGGMADFVAAFSSVYAAQKFIENENTQHTLLDTLPSLQWAHLYNTNEGRIVQKGKIEIWGREDIGNEDDEETKFTWSPCDDEKDLQPLMVQAANDNSAREKAEEERIAKEEAKLAAEQAIEDSVANTIIRVVPFDLGVIDSVVDEIEVQLEFAFNLEAMKQEGEITNRHVKVLTISFSDEDKALLESMGGPSAPGHWVSKAQQHFDDEMIMAFFENEVLTEDEVSSVAEVA
ncbi:coil containing protein [Vibrio phage 2.275.O._10N.286.54.E11]|nr:coil containing protein [Vibrio phage 2.275.O._10N.286.54.E11]